MPMFQQRHTENTKYYKINWLCERAIIVISISIGKPEVFVFVLISVRAAYACSCVNNKNHAKYRSSMYFLGAHCAQYLAVVLFGFP